MSQTLSYLDVVIASVALLMMATSIVLTLTQLIIALLKKRKEILTTNLAKLLQDVGLGLEVAEKLAAEIVGDPKIKEQGGSVVTREQLVELLLEMAAKTDSVSIALKDKLGVQNPENALQSMRDRVLKLEAEFPALADHVRRTQAIVEQTFDASGQAIMVGIVKIMSGFDRVCDRMTHAMQTHARGWTIVFSAVVAVVLPLDSIVIVKQLANNPTDVQQLVETAKALKERGVPADQDEDDIAKLQAQLKAQIKQITNPALGIQPLAVLTADYWRPEAADQTCASRIVLRVAGILISIGLMSLGAPFWFDVLKKLLALRPSLASKETVERTERTTTTST
jgi:hypothetical protein